jgi:multisubunit Na+/H+ antiporter MnhB subunit
MILERIFQVIAAVLAGAAAYLFWYGHKDAGFISAVVGSVAFFLSIRFQVKERNRIRESERETARESGDRVEGDPAQT